MSIELFQHNKEAYFSAVQMLKIKGKAAVIHPTGTGKSFIGFQLCAQNPKKTVCWLSPSEYIFKTQLENLSRAAGGYTPKNIRFFTYAKLMNLTEDELKSIQPDYIILDEFHRCGAEQWGAGVNSLLNLYKGVPILGLSATAIRYLDNQRNMSDELFDGNVASEITLGEAIVRGILKPPKYVLSVFSFQKQLLAYEKRVHAAKSKAVQHTAEKYLEAVRRALEKADGLDVVFQKHMAEPNGKYIVFCANKEHMHEMVSHAGAWFAKVDRNPHIYTAYANDPATGKAFEAFKADESRHLKLLYCIDMLNEGIHVENVNGVILLRPTVSPIIYKQQIGRALAAGKKSNAVIFDIVLNIENLFSIGAVEEEMQIATAYYRSLGEESQIVHEHFGVIDEVQSCRDLFQKLEGVLSASWPTMYACATQYYKENGNLEVPARYKTPEGYALGSWIYSQRYIYNGRQAGALTKEQILKLNAIGMRWSPQSDYTWEVNFNAAKRYYGQHGNLDVPSRYVTEDGILLGSWLHNLRTWESAGAHPKYLTPERKKQLEAIGMIWCRLDLFWENNFAAAAAYYREHGNLLVPARYVSPSGVRLGAWVTRLRSLKRGEARCGTPPTAEQVKRLNAIGMDWSTGAERRWKEGYRAAVLYYQKNGSLPASSAYRTAEGFTLGQWLKNQRRAFLAGTLTPERKALLDQIGFDWKKKNSWLQNYQMAAEYYRENQTNHIPQNMVVNGVWLGKWVFMQKKYLREGKLTAEQAELLRQFPQEPLRTRPEKASSAAR